MKKNSLIATILSGILFCTSCNSVKMIVIDIEKPAQIVLPNNIESIGIANNAVPQPHSWGHVDYKYTKKGERVDTNVRASSDSVCSIFTEKLFENLSSSTVFKNVSLYEYPLREDTSFEEQSTIDSLFIIDLCKLMNSDAIVSLDRYLVNTTYHEESYNLDLTAKFLDLKMDVLFSIYSKDGSSISSSFYFSDSIFWEAVYNDKLLISEDSIPSREDAIKQAAIYSADKIANAFISSWTSEPRIYYGDSKEANKLVGTDNWLGASTVWKKAYDNETKIKKKARLALNIALAYELSDNIREALRWSQNSVQLFTESAETSVDQNNLSVATGYYNELLNRHKDFRLLDIKKND